MVIGTDIITDRRFRELVESVETDHEELELPEEGFGEPMGGLTCSRCGNPKHAHEMRVGKGLKVTTICKRCFGESVRAGHATRTKAAPAAQRQAEVPRKTLHQAVLCCPHCGKVLFNLKA